MWRLERLGCQPQLLAVDNLGVAPTDGRNTNPIWKAYLTFSAHSLPRLQQEMELSAKGRDPIICFLSSTIAITASQRATDALSVWSGYILSPCIHKRAQHLCVSNLPLPHVKESASVMVYYGPSRACATCKKRRKNVRFTSKTF